MLFLGNGAILCGNGTRDSTMITDLKFKKKNKKRILDDDGRHCQLVLNEDQQ